MESKRETKTASDVAHEIWGEGTGFPTGFAGPMIELIAAGIQADREQRDRTDVERIATRYGITPERIRALGYTLEEKRGHYLPHDRVQAARHILGFRGEYEHGVDPGGFISSLLLTWGKADSVNKQRLAIAFPVYADALDAHDDGILLEWAGLAPIHPVNPGAE